MVQFTSLSSFLSLSTRLTFLSSDLHFWRPGPWGQSSLSNIINGNWCLCDSVLSDAEGPGAWKDNADRHRRQVPLPAVRQADRSQQQDRVRLRPRLPADRTFDGDLRPPSVEPAGRAPVRAQETPGHEARLHGRGRPISCQFQH